MPHFSEFSPELFHAQNQRPQFSLDSKGILSFNSAAYLALDEPKAVALLFDHAERIIAMRKVPPDYSNALAVRREQTDSARYVIEGSQDFAAYYAISLPQNQVSHYQGNQYSRELLGFPLDDPQIRLETSPKAIERAFASRWIHTTDGARAASMLRLTNTTMSHPGLSQLVQTRHSSIRVGVAITTSSAEEVLSTSAIRSRFLSLLRSRAVSNFITDVSNVDSGAQWAPYAGRGAEVHEAILTTDDLFREDALPLAAALLHLPQRPVGGSDSFDNARPATLLIEVTLREPAGRPLEPVSLVNWHNRFRLAFAIPEAFRRNLTEAMKLNTLAQPPVEAGIWLNSPHSLLEIVDIQDIPIIPGSPAPNWFMGFAIADRRGETARQVALDFLGQLCDYTLHLDGYERQLAKFANGRGKS